MIPNTYSIQPYSNHRLDEMEEKRSKTLKH